MNRKILIAVIAIILLLALFAYVRHKTTVTPNLNDTENITYIGPHGNLSEVKVATLYEKVTDRELIGGRSLNETINVIKQTNTDLIFRGFWIWNGPVPESSENISPEITNVSD